MIKVENGFISGFEVEIPDGVLDIESSDFLNMTKLKKVTIPKSVRNINKRSFGCCINLEEIIFAQDGELVSIDDNAFSGCYSLNRIELPDSLWFIEREAFSECTGLEEIIVPDSVVKIEEDAFLGCKGVRKITIPQKFEKTINQIFKDVDLSYVNITYIKGEQ